MVKNGSAALESDDGHDAAAMAALLDPVALERRLAQARAQRAATLAARRAESTPVAAPIHAAPQPDSIAPAPLPPPPAADTQPLPVAPAPPPLVAERRPRPPKRRRILPAGTVIGFALGAAAALGAVLFLAPDQPTVPSVIAAAPDAVPLDSAPPPATFAEIVVPAAPVQGLPQPATAPPSASEPQIAPTVEVEPAAPVESPPQPADAPAGSSEPQVASAAEVDPAPPLELPPQPAPAPASSSESQGALTAQIDPATPVESSQPADAPAGSSEPQVASTAEVEPALPLELPPQPTAAPPNPSDPQIALTAEIEPAEPAESPHPAVAPTGSSEPQVTSAAQIEPTAPGATPVEVSAPDPAVADSESADSDPVVAEAPNASPADFADRPLRLILHAPSGVPAAEVEAALARLEQAVRAPEGPVAVRFPISRPNVRYYHPEDADAAQAAAASLEDRFGAVEARDFTSYQPRPALGTIEVWLAGDLGGRPAAARGRASSRAAAAPQQPAPPPSTMPEQLSGGQDISGLVQSVLEQQAARAARAEAARAMQEIEAQPQNPIHQVDKAVGNALRRVYGGP